MSFRAMASRLIPGNKPESTAAPAHQANPEPANPPASQSEEEEAAAAATDSPAPNPSGAAAGTVDIDKEIEDVDHQLPPLPNPLPIRHRDFVHAMPPNPVVFDRFSVFLAGSIEMGRAIQWQRHMAQFLQDLPITVCNPRRGMWNTAVTSQAKDAAFREQVEWELTALENCSVICFFFDKNTQSPVTMLELGLWASSRKVVVCCDEGFWKAGNVHIVCQRYNIPFVTNFADLIPEIKSMLKSKGMDIDVPGGLDNDDRALPAGVV